MRKTNLLSSIPALATLLLLSAVAFAGRYYMAPLQALMSDTDDDAVKSIKTRFEKANDKFPSERLYLQLDKPLYLPGETIWFQAYLLNARNMKPSSTSQIMYVDLIDPRGTTLKTLTLATDEGTVGGDFELDPSLPGGAYKVKAYTKWMKEDPTAWIFEKEITVQRTVLPRLKLKFDFLRKAYGPADEVQATLEMADLQNEPLRNKRCQLQVSVEGNRYVQKDITADDKGKLLLSFNLPEKLNRPDATVTVLISHEGQMESITRSVPVTLNKITISFFPEGGDIVSGLESNVAFRALNEFNKPADVDGVVTDEKDNVVAHFSSFHQGMGAFALKPAAGKTYKARITRPAGIKETFTLPAAKTDGYAMQLLPSDHNKSLKIKLQSTRSTAAYLVVRQRDALYHTRKVSLNQAGAETNVDLSDMPIGVAQLTLFDAQGVPQAERLVFVNKHKQVNLKITSDKEQYLPREKVTLKLEAKDHRGNPLKGRFSLSVVDDKLISYADDRTGQILPRLLLEPELKEEVAQPSWYFYSGDPKADDALDYLMLTSGWRRFAWKEIMNDEIKARPERTSEKNLVKITLKKTDTTGLAAWAATHKIAYAEPTDKRNGRKGRKVRRAYYPSPYFSTQKEPLTLTYTQASITTAKGRKLKRFSNGKGEFSLRLQPEEFPVVIRSTQPGFFQSSLTVHGYGEFQMLVGHKNVYNANYRYDNYAYKDMEDDVEFAVRPQMMMRNAIALPEQKVEVKAARVKRKAVRAELEVEEMEALEVQPALAAPAPAPEPVPVPMEDLKKVDKKQEEVVAKAIAPPVVNMGVQADSVRVINGIVADLDLRQAWAGNAAPMNFNVNNNLALQWNNLNVGTYTVWFVNDSNQEAGIKREFYRAREFAAPVYAKVESPETRTDFRSTLFWKGEVKTDAAGRGEISFYASDDITAFRVNAEGVSANGLLAHTEITFHTQLPFMMAARIPVAAAAGDEINLPVLLKNNTAHVMDGKLQLNYPKAWVASEKIPAQIHLAAGEAKTLYIPFKVLPKEGKEKLALKFEAQGLKDALEQDVETFPRGFPVELSFSGAGLDKTFALQVSRPLEGSLKAQFTAYPRVMEQFASGMGAMMQEPYGCFEQASGANYPNILALQFMKDAGDVDAELAKRANGLLDRGYKKLVGYQTKEGGFEWFGQSPAHEALTAYGVLEFTDMQGVFQGVDKEMLDRALNWLLSRRDTKGGFLLNSRALDQFGRANQEITNAYIVYALTEAGVGGIDKELNAALEGARRVNDGYALGLMANAFLKKGDPRGQALVQEMINKQQADGSFSARLGSITQSQGGELLVETTSLWMMAMIRAGSNYEKIRQAADYLQTQRHGGGFGNTQTTVMALKALGKYAAAFRSTREDGRIALLLNGQETAFRKYTAGETGNLSVTGLEAGLKEGTHKLQVVFAGAKQAMPYSGTLRWTTEVPDNHPQRSIDLKTSFAETKVEMGENVRMTVSMKNRTNTAIASPMLIVGLPGGVSPDPTNLKELRDKGYFDFYEIAGQNLYLYYRGMKAGEEKIIPLDLKADVPGSYEAPASRAYPYYESGRKCWSKPERLTITPPAKPLLIER